LASFLRFWTLAAMRNSPPAPFGPRIRARRAALWWPPWARGRKVFPPGPLQGRPQLHPPCSGVGRANGRSHAPLSFPTGPIRSAINHIIARHKFTMLQIPPQSLPRWRGACRQEPAQCRAQACCHRGEQACLGPCRGLKRLVCAASPTCYRCPAQARPRGPPFSPREEPAARSGQLAHVPNIPPQVGIAPRRLSYA
jgi:hypothetical protein